MLIQLMEPGWFWWIFSLGRKGAGGAFRRAIYSVPTVLGMEGSLSLCRRNFLFHIFLAYQVARNIKEEWNIPIWSEPIRFPGYSLFTVQYENKSRKIQYFQNKSWLISNIYQSLLDNMNFYKIKVLMLKDATIMQWIFLQTSPLLTAAWGYRYWCSTVVTAVLCIVKPPGMPWAMEASLPPAQTHTPNRNQNLPGHRVQTQN